MRAGVNYTSAGHVIKIDHARHRAVMSAVYLADNKHMVRKQMTAEREGEKEREKERGS